MAASYGDNVVPVTEHNPKERSDSVHPIVLECRSCNIVPVNESALKSHFLSKAHRQREFEAQNPFSVYPLSNLRIVRCSECKLSYIDSDALRQHRLNNPLHLPSFCQQCQRWFGDEFSLKQHLRDSPKHRKVVYISVVTGDTFRKCSICGKKFKTERALKDHNTSPVHRPRTIGCVSCPNKFKTASGVAHHIESSCKQLSVNRHQITAAIQTLEIEPAISLRPLVPGSAATECRSLIAYQAFHSLAALNTHLNSPAHDEDEFKCPKCKQQFTLISGLVQHLESGACDFAVADVMMIDSNVERLTSRIRLRGFYAHSIDRFGLTCRNMYYECRGCTKTFSTLQGVTMHGDAKGHLISIYPVGIVECPPCGRLFKNREALDQHLRHSSAHQYLVVRSDTSVGNTFCHICDKTFRTPDDLMRMHRRYTGLEQSRASFAPRSSRHLPAWHSM
ncbi:hypothetical protein APHAL10511_006924 [Amanita phalloides]|nr:hypothetical protein APHAL10511_006924 [Amanita phalloides]